MKAKEEETPKERLARYEQERAERMAGYVLRWMRRWQYERRLDQMLAADEPPKN